MSVAKVASCGSVLIGGGTGFIGRALRRVLEKKGYECAIVSREGDGQDRKSWFTWNELREQGLPPGFRAVINLAGQPLFDPTQKWSFMKNTVWTSRVNTTKILSQVIDDLPESEKPDVFICMSGVGYYSPSTTEVYTEESFGGFADYLGQLAKAWEAASRLIRSNKVRKVNLRSGVVIGRDGGAVAQMYWPFFFGVGGPIGSGEQYFPWIHVEDLVQLIIFSMENDHVKGILNAVAPQIVTNKEFAQALGGAMRRPALMHLPKFVLEQIYSDEQAQMMTQGQKVIPKRTLEMGFKYKYENIQEACKNI